LTENLLYKHSDYAIRSADLYADSKYKLVMDRLPNTPNLRILNAGCGSGEMSVILSRNATWTINALDVDEQAILLSQTLKSQHCLNNLSVLTGSIEAHDPPYRYDGIVCIDVLEHIQDDEAAVRKLALLLQPSGVFCLTVPALQWLFGYHDEMLGHYRRYNKKRLMTLLTKYFDVRHCHYFGGTLIPAALYYSVLRHTSYPLSTVSGSSLLSRLVAQAMSLERHIALPLGISLFAVATPKPQPQP
jgi:SAM-dependent methyltransferase